MALYQHNAYGDSPCDFDRLDRLDRCAYCDETVKFYDDKLKEIRILLHPIIRSLRGIQKCDKDLMECYLDSLMEECCFSGWEYQILKLKEA